MSNNISGGPPESPEISSPETSAGFMSPPGGGGAKLTPSPAGLVSQIPGQRNALPAPPQSQFAGYGIGLHGAVQGAGQPGGSQYPPLTSPAHSTPWGNRPGGSARVSVWGPPSSSTGQVVARTASFSANPVPRVTVTDHSPTRTTPGGPADGPVNMIPADNSYKAFRIELHHLSKRVLGMHEAIGRQNDLPKRFMDAIRVDLEQMIRALESLPLHVHNMAKIMKEIDEDRQNIKLLWINKTLENETLHSKDKNRNTELDDKIRELTDKQVRLQATISEMHLQRSVDQEKIRRLQEQLDGKRNLWMQMHPEPQERALALAYHGGSKPSTSFGASSLHPESAAATSTNWRPNRSGSPGHQKTLSQARSVSTGPLKTEQRFVEPRFAPSRPTQQPSTDGPPKPGFQGGSTDPKPAVTSTALAAYRPALGPKGPEGLLTKSEAGSPLKMGATPKSQVLQSDMQMAADSPLKFWQENMRKLWALSLGFCNSYVGRDWVPDLPVFIQGKAPQVWDTIATSLHPRDPKARDQAWQSISELLRDQVSRTFLAQRLVVQHILRHVFRPSGWLGFDMLIDEEFQKIQKELDENSTFKPHERASILDRRAALVLTMLDDPRWDQFRHTKVNEHFQGLKTAVWALAPDAKAAEMVEAAHFDLFSMIELAWELATKLFLSRADFYFHWPDVGDKFTPESHFPADLQREPASAAEAKFWRVRLAVTPGVTMRRPEGMKIAPLRILRANVLAA